MPKYTEQHFLVVESLADADVTYAFAANKIPAPSCAPSCKFVDCTCTPAANGNGCNELQVDAPSADAPWGLWTLRWDPWKNVGVDSSTAGLYGTTYCELQLHFHDNSATADNLNTASFAKDHPEGLRTRTLTLLLEATPGNNAEINMPPRATQFWASNSNVDLTGENTVTGYFVQIEDNTAGVEASLGYLPLSCTGAATACFTPFASLKSFTCKDAAACALSWSLNVSEAASNGAMSSTPGSTNKVHLRLVDGVTGDKVVTEMPSVRIVPHGKVRARRDAASLRSGQFNIAIDGDGRLTASESTAFLVEPTGTGGSSTGINGGNDGNDGSNGGNNSNGSNNDNNSSNGNDGNGNVVSDEQGQGISADVGITENRNENGPNGIAGGNNVTYVNLGPGADANTLKWAQVASIAAFTALLLSVVVLAMMCNRRNPIRPRSSKIKVHPMSAEAVAAGTPSTL